MNLRLYETLECIICIFLLCIWGASLPFLGNSGINTYAVMIGGAIVLITIGDLLSILIYRIMYRQTRQNSLDKAVKYLTPYQSIWKKLVLSNYNCTLAMKNRHTLLLQRLNSSCGRLATLFSEEHIKIENDVFEPFDFFCMNFSDDTTFEHIIKACDMMNVRYDIQKSEPIKTNKESIPKLNIETKIDINNAFLEELKTLPFINTALAKRIIKKREEIGGFKTVEDVCLYLNFNVEKSIKFREYICVNPIVISPADIKFDERSVDW